MYTVTARDTKLALEESQLTKLVAGQEVPLRGSMPFISFPWLFVCELGRIASGTTQKPDPVYQGSYLKKKAKPLIVPPPGPSTADIETRQGVTHYGDFLRLDFGDGDEDGSETAVASITSSTKSSTNGDPTSPTGAVEIAGIMGLNDDGKASEDGGTEVGDEILTYLLDGVDGHVKSAMDRLMVFEE